jgi:hypothetical protein
MTATLDLRIATPVEIDTILADLDYERYAAMIRKIDLWQAADKARNYVHYDWRTRTSTPRPDLERAAKLEALAQEQEAIESAKSDEMAPYQEEFSRRGGWTRAFLVVTSGTGHVHSSQRCHTCYPTTQFHWVTKLSGHDEAEIVEAAGERACTICYPSAPAYVLNRPTALFTKDEEAKQAARAEREAKRAAKAALEVIDPATGKMLFKTERGATNDIAWQLDGYLRSENEEYLDKAKKIVMALAAKRDEDPAALLEGLMDKASKKHRREAIKSIKEMLASKGRQPEFYDNSDPANWYASTRRIAQEEGLI